jgi:acetyl esterase/lipase
MAAVAVLGLTLAACSSGSSGTTAAPSATKAGTLKACPADTQGAPGGAGGGAGASLPAGVTPPAGADAGGTGGMSIPVAKTIKKTDTSTSTVLNVDSDPQIQCGKTTLTSTKDVVYSSPTLSSGKKVELKLDVLTPTTSGTKPLVVYMSGGGFSMSTKSAALDRRTYLAEAGYTVVSIEYRTVNNGATYVQGVQDVRSAVRYLRAHAAEYNINPAKVAVWGESAGGYLAAMTGVTNGVAKFNVGDNLDQSSDVQGVIDEFGPSDITKVAADYDEAAKVANDAAGGSLAKWIFGPNSKNKLTDDPKAAAPASPLTYVDAKDPAFILFHGSADALVSPSQTLILSDKLKAAGVDSTRYVVTGAGHGDLTVPGATGNTKLWTTTGVVDKMVDFLDKQLAS